MFRALLWKEWRELWMLPVVAVPLAAMSLFITNAATQHTTPIIPGSTLMYTRPLSSVVWDTSFAVWLLLAAIYIPTHLYAREEDLMTSQFMSAMPLDRFKLWWIRLFIGITAMAGVGLTLWAVIMTLKLFHRTDHSFFFHGSYIVMASACVGFMLFSLSSLFSSLFKRQISALAGVVITLGAVGALFWIYLKFGESTSLLDFYDDYTNPTLLFTVLGRYSFSRDLNYPGILLLILCPGLLFLSLAVFAKGNMARQSRRRIALTYAFLAIVALSPVLMGLSRLSEGAQASGLEWSDDIRNWSVAPDGKRIFLQTGRALFSAKKRSTTADRLGPLVSIDLSERRLKTIEDNLVFPNAYMHVYFHDARDKETGVVLIKNYRGKWARIFPDTVDRIDLDGTLKKNTFTGNWFDSGKTDYRGVTWPKWSIDGKYSALVKGPSRKRREDGFVEIKNASGDSLGKLPIPLSEQGETYLMGWDYDSRFYLLKYHKEPSPKFLLYRISPGNMVPEEIPNIPPGVSRNWLMSPDGRWITFRQKPSPEGEEKFWLYDIAQETSRFIGNDVCQTQWSPDGRLLAYSVYDYTPPDAEPAWLKFKKLLLFDTETGETRSFFDDSGYNLKNFQWSPSGEHLLFGYQTYTRQDDGMGGLRLMPSGPVKVKLMTIDTEQVTAVAQPTETSVYNWSTLRWIANDRLMWKQENKLIATEKDGSNPEEIFRIEGGKFYLYGEEQS